MSFETKDVVARIEAMEREMGDLKQSNMVISIALIKLHKLVEDAAEQMSLPEAPEASD